LKNCFYFLLEVAIKTRQFETAMKKIVLSLLIAYQFDKQSDLRANCIGRKVVLHGNH
jgi:hypothetical protein